MSALERDSAGGAKEAAAWLRRQSEPQRFAVPALRAKFHLSAKEACEAIALARTNQQREA